MPGDPSTALVSPGMPREARQLIVEQYGLNEPLSTQYVLYIANLLQGNMGISFSRSEHVAPLIFDRALNTMALKLTSITLAFLLGPLVGAYLAWHRGSRLDTIGIGAILFMRGAPVFWTGMLAIMIFSFQLGWLPTGGIHSANYIYNNLYERFISVDFLWHLILPVTVTTLYYFTIPTFIMRNSMIDVLGEDFIELSKAKGFSDIRIIYRHAARNSLLPVLHYAAVAVAFAFSGSVVIETVFSWPGVGKLMWDAVRAADYPLAQGAFLVLAVLIITLNFVADILSVYVDPRSASEEGM
jgi:peptide/nickel transport system permease protein